MANLSCHASFSLLMQMDQITDRMLGVQTCRISGVSAESGQSQTGLDGDQNLRTSYDVNHQHSQPRPQSSLATVPICSAILSFIPAPTDLSGCCASNFVPWLAAKVVRVLPSSAFALTLVQVRQNLLDHQAVCHGRADKLKRTVRRALRSPIVAANSFTPHARRGESKQLWPSLNPRSPHSSSASYC